MNIPNSSSIFLNCEKCVFDGVGKYEVPTIKPFDMDIENVPLLGFNYALAEKEPQDKIVHFYLDDYRFECVWNNPDNYLDALRRFKAVLSPDFSMYSDFPRAVSMFNHYRKQWCGAYWQKHGINVIPTIGWTRPDSYEYCFDGIPRNSLVCISTVGMFFDKEHRDKFVIGYHNALDILKPKKILFYGKLYPEIDIPDGIEYAVAKNLNTAKLSERRDAKRKAEKERKNAEKKS